MVEADEVVLDCVRSVRVREADVVGGTVGARVLGRPDRGGAKGKQHIPPGAIVFWHCS